MPVAQAFIAIGASGEEGIADINALLSKLPANLCAVVLVVLHRPVDKVSYLREVLAAESSLPVKIAEEGAPFDCGTCYIGEPAGHLTVVARSLAHLVDDPDALLRNRTVDALFHSVARHAGPRLIGVVLSGKLDDGSRGLAAIKRTGGITMVVGSAQQALFGMPENAACYGGPVDFIGTPREIAQEIEGVVKLSFQVTDTTLPTLSGDGGRREPTH
jgi:chemotaxis response regulator CheB